MIKSVVVAVTASLLMGNAVSAIRIISAPPAWEQSTDSSSEIKSYLDSINDGKNTKSNDSSAEVTNELNHYRDHVQKKINEVFSGNDISQYTGTVCKISFSTGKTAPSDPTPPNVVSLDFLADNTTPGCKALSNKLTDLVNHEKEFKYPVLVKESGLLSINFIFVFDDEK